MRVPVRERGAARDSDVVARGRFALVLTEIRWRAVLAQPRSFSAVNGTLIIGISLAMIFVAVFPRRWIVESRTPWQSKLVDL